MNYRDTKDVAVLRNKNKYSNHRKKPMESLLLTTVLTCNQLLTIVNRLSIVIGLSYSQKIELIRVLTDSVPSCPVIISKNK